MSHDKLGIIPAKPGDFATMRCAVKELYSAWGSKGSGKTIVSLKNIIYEFFLCCGLLHNFL